MRILLLLLLLAVGEAFLANSQTIITIAGNGTPGYSGDGGLAVSAQLNSPFGIAADGQGNIYIADRFNHRIRKIDPSGIISTVAGNGTTGYGGDGGIATAAQLNSPVCVHADAGGNIYIADLGNQRVRKVNTAGVISTIAGNGTAGYSGDGGPATSALLNAPRGVTIDPSGNIFIADAGNHCIRKISTAGIITTIAGTGTSGFSGDGGSAVNAQLYGPYSVATDDNGNILIADVDNQRIRKITADGIIHTIVGTGIGAFSGDDGPATSASLYEPICVAADSKGNVYIADGWNNRIRQVDAAGIITTVAGNGMPGFSGDGGLPAATQLNNPFGIALDSRGNTYIADYNNHRIRKVLPATAPQYEFVPNPVTTELVVRSAKSASTTVYITDCLGRQMLQQQVSGAQTNINLSALPTGLYYASIKDGSDEVVHRFVKL